jgi:hypothetical protein
VLVYSFKIDFPCKVWWLCCSGGWGRRIAELKEFVTSLDNIVRPSLKAKQYLSYPFIVKFLLAYISYTRGFHFGIYICAYNFFLQYWGLSSRPTPWATPPVHFCDEFFWEKVLQTLPGLASNHDPPDLCLLSSQDYRHEPPACGYNVS